MPGNSGTVVALEVAAYPIYMAMWTGLIMQQKRSLFTFLEQEPC